MMPNDPKHPRSDALPSRRATIIKYVVNPDGSDRIVDASPSCKDIFELTPDALRADASILWRMVNPDQVDGLSAAIRKAAADRTPWEYYWQVTPPSGTTRWIYGNGVPYRQDDGTILWDTFVVDLSETEAVRDAFHESERRFRDLAEHVPGAIFRYTSYTDGTDSIDYMSRGGEAIWEISVDEIEADTSKIWAMVHLDDIPGMREAIKVSAKTLRPWFFSWRIIPASGQIKWLEGRGTPLQSSDGSISWNSLVLDVTARKNAEFELRGLLEKSQEAERTKTRFLAHMSHELRTPLNGISGFAELIVGQVFGPLGNDRYREYGKLIGRASDHLQSVINDILEAAVIETDQYGLTEGVVPIGQITSFVLEISEAAVAEKNLNISAGNECDTVLIRCDKVKLRQALLNLLSNAIRHSPKNGTIWVRNENSTDGGVEFSVSDQGPGIAPEQIPRLTQPFTRAERDPHVNPSEGVGLGLYITRSIIELHGGRLTIESDGKSGATASFSLPKARVAG